jgi:hypothetical protein
MVLKLIFVLFTMYNQMMLDKKEKKNQQRPSCPQIRPSSSSYRPRRVQGLTLHRKFVHGTAPSSALPSRLLAVFRSFFDPATPCFFFVDFVIAQEEEDSSLSLG